MLETRDRKNHLPHERYLFVRNEGDLLVLRVTGDHEAARELMDRTVASLVFLEDAGGGS